MIVGLARVGFVENGTLARQVRNGRPRLNNESQFGDPEPVRTHVGACSGAVLKVRLTPIGLQVEESSEAQAHVVDLERGAESGEKGVAELLQRRDHRWRAPVAVRMRRGGVDRVHVPTLRQLRQPRHRDHQDAGCDRHPAFGLHPNGGSVGVPVVR